MKILLSVLVYLGAALPLCAGEPASGTFIQASGIGAFALLVSVLIVAGRCYPESRAGRIGRFFRGGRS